MIHETKNKIIIDEISIDLFLFYYVFLLRYNDASAVRNVYRSSFVIAVRAVPHDIYSFLYK